MGITLNTLFHYPAIKADLTFQGRYTASRQNAVHNNRKQTPSAFVPLTRGKRGLLNRLALASMLLMSQACSKPAPVASKDTYMAIRFLDDVTPKEAIQQFPRPKNPLTWSKSLVTKIKDYMDRKGKTHSEAFSLFDYREAIVKLPSGSTILLENTGDPKTGGARLGKKPAETLIRISAPVPIGKGNNKFTLIYLGDNGRIEGLAGGLKIDPGAVEIYPTDEQRGKVAEVESLLEQALK